MRLTSLLAAALLGSTAHGAEPGLFGIALGSRLEDIPRCEGASSVLEAPEKLCLDGDVAYRTAPNGYDQRLTRLPRNKPDYLAVVEVAAKDGKVENVTALTEGLPVQGEVFKALRSKFGAPKELSREAVRTGLGTTFGRIRARWNFSGATLFFYGGYTADRGLITLQTSAYARSINADEKEKQSQQLKP